MACEEFREINDHNEDEIPIDTNPASLLMWSKQSRNTVNALSRQGDKANSDKATEEWKDKAALNARPTKLCDDFWADFVLMSKVCLLRNKEADLFDVFDTIRTKFMGGWGFTKEQLEKLDAEIEAEYQKELKRGLRTA